MVKYSLQKADTEYLERPQETDVSSGTRLRPLRPRSNDVLCGRGVTCDGHPGNINFRRIIAKYKPRYQKASLRTNRNKTKQAIVSTVMKEIQGSSVPPPRFLFKDLDTGGWCEADYKTAYEKTTRALRQVQKPNLISSENSLFISKDRVNVFDDKFFFEIPEDFLKNTCGN